MFCSTPIHSPALSRAIVRKPKVFLMDEPLSNLDAKLRVQTRSEISKIHKRIGATTIYVTHDQTEAMSMADRIVIMKDGYIQQIGTPDEVYENPSNVFVGGFIGSPAMNFLKVHYEDGVLIPLKEEHDSSLISAGHNNEMTIKVPEQYHKLLKEYEDKDLIFGIRPEAVKLLHKDDADYDKATSLECDYIELLGHESVIYSYICGQKFVIKTNTKESMKDNTNIKIQLNDDKMYFFDIETENRIK